MCRGVLFEMAHNRIFCDITLLYLCTEQQDDVINLCSSSSLTLCIIGLLNVLLDMNSLKDIFDGDELFLIIYNFSKKILIWKPNKNVFKAIISEIEL